MSRDYRDVIDKVVTSNERFRKWKAQLPSSDPCLNPSLFGIPVFVSSAVPDDTVILLNKNNDVIKVINIGSEQ